MKMNDSSRKSRVSIDQSMGDATEDKIVLVDAKGNTLGEVPRSTRGEVPKETPASRPDYNKRRRLSKRERRKRKRRAVIAVCLELILGIAIIAAATVLFSANFCKIENVNVTGSNIYDDSQIAALVVDGKYPDNCVYEVIHNFWRPKKNIPFIDGIKVKMTGLRKLDIAVSERTPISYVAVDVSGDNTSLIYKYFDEDGIISDISDIRLLGSTEWTGIAATGDNVGDEIYDDAVMLDVYLEVIGSLKVNEIALDSIYIDDNHNIYGVKGEIKINFGLKNDIDDKCKRLSIIVPQLEGQAGTLHLENFTPENTDIVFKKENSN